MKSVNKVILLRNLGKHPEVKLAELAGEHMKKGNRVYVEGRLETRSWDKDGEKRYTTTVVTTELALLGGRESSGGKTQRITGARQASEERQNPH